MVPSCHCPSLHRAHHLLLPERHLAGEEGARARGEAGGDGQDWDRWEHYLLSRMESHNHWPLFGGLLGKRNVPTKLRSISPGRLLLSDGGTLVGGVSNCSHCFAGTGEAFSKKVESFSEAFFSVDAEKNLEETTIRDREFAYTTACLVEGGFSCHPVCNNTPVFVAEGEFSTAWDLSIHVCTLAPNDTTCQSIGPLQS